MIAYHLLKVSFPVSVWTELQVPYALMLLGLALDNDDEFSEISIKGPARFVFEGVIEV